METRNRLVTRSSQMTVSDPGYGASGGRSQEKFSQAGSDGHLILWMC